MEDEIPEPPETAGARFGKYTVVRKLGEGAFGSVYEAILPGAMGFTKRVAIKRIRPHVLAANPGFVEAMAQEARLGGLLHHAHIVDVLEFDQVDGHHYLAMEYVDGATLSQVLSLCGARGVLLPQFAVLDLSIQVCRGLHFAHGLRDTEGQPLELVHRDLKPSNILVDREGTARIADFGIAKVASDLGGDLTSSGAIKGTPRYMSPEQIGGDRVTARSDIFAMGAVLFEMIGGRPLFVADSLIALAHQIMEGDLGESLDEADAALPGSRAILARALEREPGGRYPDARAMADDLRTLARQHPVEIDMAEVIGRLMPVVERTMTGDAMDSSAFERELAASVGPPAPSGPPTEKWNGPSPGEATGAWEDFTAAFEVSDEGARPAALVPSAERGAVDRPAGHRGMGWAAVVIGVMGILGAVGIWVWTGGPGEAVPGPASGSVVVEESANGPDRRSAPAAELSSLRSDTQSESEPVRRTVESETEPVRRTAESETEPVRRTAESETSPGTISLYTQPWSRIYIDGEYVGQLNTLKAHALDGGTHEIRLICPNFENREKVFEVDLDGQHVDLGCWDFDRMAVCEGT